MPPYDAATQALIDGREGACPTLDIRDRPGRVCPLYVSSQVLPQLVSHVSLPHATHGSPQGSAVGHVCTHQHSGTNTDGLQASGG